MKNIALFFCFFKRIKKRGGNQGKKMEAWTGVEPVYAILQTAA